MDADCYCEINTASSDITSSSNGGAKVGYFLWNVYAYLMLSYLLNDTQWN
jgi:hypothetical protein